MIVKEAVKEAKEKDSVVVIHTDDVDVFCLCIHHCKDVPGEFSFKLLKRMKTITVKSGVSEMSMKKWMIVYLITYCFSTHGLVVTQHLVPVGWETKAYKFFPSVVLIITVLLMKSIAYRLLLTDKSNKFLIWINISFQFYQIKKL